MLDRRDNEVLDLGFPEEPDVETDYLLTLKDVLESPDFIEEMRAEQMKEPHPMLVEAKDKLRMAMNAASGMKKIIEQLHSENAEVKISSHEKEVKRAIRRVFGTNSDKITFQMYKKAIEKMRLISNDIKDKVVNEQAR